MSDSWFIGTVSRAHGLVRDNHVLYNRTFPQDQDSPSSKQQTGLESIRQSKNTFETPKRSIGMMVSLDHTIYFHRPREVKADEWMCTEMETPWSGEGRGLVMQRIWNKEGRLMATCVQEVSLNLLYCIGITRPDMLTRICRAWCDYDKKILRLRANCSYIEWLKK